MKAIVLTRYGPPDVLKLKDVEKPTPADDEVLVKVHAVSLNYADVAMMGGGFGKPLVARLMGVGLFRPKVQILGSDIAGTVKAVGTGVTQFQPGDEVFGDISAHGRGGLAEYAAAPEEVLAPKPANVTFEQAATIGIAGVTALQGLRDVGQIQAGEQVLIHGATGGVGSFAVQIAKANGAEVTAVCSTDKMDMAREMGADHVVDYKREDFAQNERRYDLILAVNGNRSLADYRRVLKPQGRHVVAGGSLRQIFGAIIRGPRLSEEGGQQIGNVDHHTDQEGLSAMGELLEAGNVVPVIDGPYPLEETAEAFRRLIAGRVQGKAVITVA